MRYESGQIYWACREEEEEEDQQRQRNNYQEKKMIYVLCLWKLKLINDYQANLNSLSSLLSTSSGEVTDMEIIDKSRRELPT